jgi:hypothetical protein
MIAIHVFMILLLVFLIRVSMQKISRIKRPKGMLKNDTYCLTTLILVYLSIIFALMLIGDSLIRIWLYSLSGPELMKERYFGMSLDAYYDTCEDDIFKLSVH